MLETLSKPGVVESIAVALGCVIGLLVAKYWN
jgi:hypothetical protein